jgi:hypothetical protein
MRWCHRASQRSLCFPAQLGTCQFQLRLLIAVSLWECCPHAYVMHNPTLDAGFFAVQLGMHHDQAVLSDAWAPSWYVTMPSPGDGRSGI